MDSVLCRQSVIKINSCNSCNSWFSSLTSSSLSFRLHLRLAEELTLNKSDSAHFSFLHSFILSFFHFFIFFNIFIFSF